MAAGRPRAFCVDEALDRALHVFWQKGYEGTSLLDLTEAMGINRPSLYAAFGNKESLFRKALDRYAEKNACMISLLDVPDARAGVATLLNKMVEKLTDPEVPQGCLSVTGALSCSDDTVHIKEELKNRRKQFEIALRSRLEKADKQGQLPAQGKPDDLARYFATVLQGLSVQASGGATREELQTVADTALLAWPR